MRFRWAAVPGARAYRPEFFADGAAARRLAAVDTTGIGVALIRFLTIFPWPAPQASLRAL